MAKDDDGKFKFSLDVSDWAFKIYPTTTVTSWSNQFTLNKSAFEDIKLHSFSANYLPSHSELKSPGFTCAQCNKPIKKVNFEYNGYNAGQTLKAVCHGEVEQVFIADEIIENKTYSLTEYLLSLNPLFSNHEVRKLAIDKLYLATSSPVDITPILAELKFLAINFQEVKHLIQDWADKLNDKTGYWGAVDDRLVLINLLAEIQ